MAYAKAHPTMPHSRATRPHDHQKWRWLLIGFILMLLTFAILALTAAPSDASVDVVKLYATKVTRVTPTDHGHWLIEGTTKAPSNAKLIGLKDDHTASLAAAVKDPAGWPTVKNGRFTVTINAYQAMTHYYYEPGDVSQVHLVALTGYQRKRFDIIPEKVQLELRDFKPLKLTLDATLSRYCLNLFNAAQAHATTTPSSPAVQRPPLSSSAAVSHSSATETQTTAPTKVTAPVGNSDQATALRTANNYLRFSQFSKQKLYKLLTFKDGDHFTPAAAHYAVEHVAVDWRAQALTLATYYRQTAKLSAPRIFNQLTSQQGEGFTPAEAQYAVDHLPK